ncbi:MAG: hypothetical protein ACJAUP_003716 [Cellvibrionaceae bacterium]|jgi:hypothetical protein
MNNNHLRNFDMRTLRSFVTIDVRKAVAFSVPLGNNLFKERIEATLGKSVGYIA